MGVKGAKMTNDSIINAAELMEKLASIQDLSTKKCLVDTDCFMMARCSA